MQLLPQRNTHAFRATALTARGHSPIDASFPRRVSARGVRYWKVNKAMFAVVRTGGKQYRVAAGDRIVVEKLAGEAGEVITLGDILLAGEGAELTPVDGLTVSAEIVAQAKAEKVIVFKKRRRHNYRRRNGHRQQHTILKIMAIGAAPAAVEADASAAQA